MLLVSTNFLIQWDAHVVWKEMEAFQVLSFPLVLTDVKSVNRSCSPALSVVTGWYVLVSWSIPSVFLFLFFFFLTWIPKLKNRKKTISILLLFGLLHMGGLSLALSCCVEDTPWPPCFPRRVGEPGPVADGGALVLPLLLQWREASISHPLQGVPCVLENSSYIRWMQTWVIRRSIFLPPSQIFY